MAKKTKETTSVVAHRDCGFCKPYTEDHLDFNGRPILGSCKMNRYYFIMSDGCDDCPYFIRKDLKAKEK